MDRFQRLLYFFLPCWRSPYWKGMCNTRATAGDRLRRACAYALSALRLTILTIPGVELMVTKEAFMINQTSRRSFLGAAAGIAGMSALGAESASAVIDPAPWGIKL